jgi:hypothetical protein
MQDFAIPENKFYAAIKKIHLTYKPSLKNEEFIESLSFAARCPVLVDLDIDILLKEWLALRPRLTMGVCRGLMKGNWKVLKTVEPHIMVLAKKELKFGLAAISGCIALQRLTLHMEGFRLFQGTKGNFKDVAEWLRNALEQENGRAIDVEILRA